MLPEREGRPATHVENTVPPWAGVRTRKSGKKLTRALSPLPDCGPCGQAPGALATVTARLWAVFLEPRGQIHAPALQLLLIRLSGHSGEEDNGLFI